MKTEKGPSPTAEADTRTSLEEVCLPGSDVGLGWLAGVARHGVGHDTAQTAWTTGWAQVDRGSDNRYPLRLPNSERKLPAFHQTCFLDVFGGRGQHPRENHSMVLLRKPQPFVVSGI